MSDELTLISAQWSVPKSVSWCVTTRATGNTQGAYGAGNLAHHVGDETHRVDLNRRSLQKQTGERTWQWLNQTHSTLVIQTNKQICEVTPEADGSFTNQPNVVCAVLTADCLPVLMCSRSGDEVAAVHAGWRGLCGGILENALARFSCAPEDILVFLGPAIGPSHFEVGEDVVNAYRQLLVNQGYSPDQLQKILQPAFIRQPLMTEKSHSDGQIKFLANIYLMACHQLQAAGVTSIHRDEFCTFSMKEEFYSYRREGLTGRFASAIWIDSH